MLRFPSRSCFALSGLIKRLQPFPRAFRGRSHLPRCCITGLLPREEIRLGLEGHSAYEITLTAIPKDNRERGGLSHNALARFSLALVAHDFAHDFTSTQDATRAQSSFRLRLLVPLRRG